MTEPSKPSASLITIIEPASRWNISGLREVWNYRELLGVFIARDIKVRYKQTLLGIAWAIIQPVVQMVIFSVIFGRLAKLPSGDLPYPIFVFAGLLPWTLFQSIVSTAGSSMLSAGGMITKIFFPRILVPLSTCGAALIDFFVSLLVLVLMMLYFQVYPSTALLVAPVYLLGIVLCALGIGLFIASLVVTYRDFRYITPFALQIWMYVTPVVYSIDLVPENYQWLLFLNPLCWFVEGFRSALLGTTTDWIAVLVSLTISSILFIAGYIYFSLTERKFADVV